MDTIYILKLEQEKYYVGKTKNAESRIQDHFQGVGAAWTKKYKPINVVKTIENCDALEEDKWTKKYMIKYGIDNVRGGSYCQIYLDSQTRKLLQRELNGNQDRCYHCGLSGHFINQCPSVRNKKCFRCKRFGHVLSECYAKTDLTRNPIDWNGCTRCGRKSHWVIRCRKDKDIFDRPIPGTLWTSVLNTFNNWI